jgi:hypothetical protein
MARPARVRMRSRKPWVFARRRLFGWKVRLLTTGSTIVLSGGRGQHRDTGNRCGTAAGGLPAPIPRRQDGIACCQAPTRYGATRGRVKPAAPVRLQDPGEDGTP